MTKLNYANRKSEGVKLGSTVAKDLKRRTRSPSSATAVHTPIDLNLEGKNLTDDGLAEFAQTLFEVLTPTNGAASAQLQILQLQGNALTTHALALLAPCIEAASDTLEELDLSNNATRIDTPQQKHEWKLFLHSFARCPLLRRLDLSNNDFSNFQAFEIFSDVYIRQFDANMACWDRDSDENVAGSLENLHALSVLDTNVEVAVGVNSKRRPPNSNAPAVYGLPATAVIGFECVNMSDAGALFLSWIVERHKFAQVDHNRKLWLKAKDEPDRAGIDTKGNNTLTVPGIKLLAEAETVPYHPFKHVGEEDDDFGDQNTLSTRRRRSSAITPSTRRTSGVDRRKRGSDAGELPSAQPLHRTTSFADLRKARKRVQRSIIEIHGVHSVELWHAAIRLLPLVRQIMLHERPRTEDDPRLRLPRLDSSRSSVPSEEVSPMSAPQPLETALPQPTYASKLRIDRVRGSPVLSILGDSRDPPTIPAVLRPEESQIKASASAQESPPPRSEPAVSGSATLAQATGEKEATIEADDARRMIGPFPEQVWARILVFLTDGEYVLADKHVETIMRYACDRRTLESEEELVGKSDSVQKWKVLEQMECLMY